MFEAAEVGHSVDDETYEARVPELRVQLVNAQYDLQQAAEFPVIVVISGDDRLSARQGLRGMHEWMDGRYVQAHALRPPSDEERQQPEFWRFWRRLPRKGSIGAFLDGWASIPFRMKFRDGADDATIRQAIQHIRQFEAALVADGALLIKLWFHTSRKEYKARLKQLGKKERKAWQLREEDLIILEHYDEIFDFAEETLEETSTGQAPWHVIESADRNYSSLRAADIILDGIMSRLATARAGHSVTATVPATVAAPANTPAATTASDAHTRSVLDTVDLSAGYEDGGYGKALAEAQSELRELSMAAHEQNISSVLAFEGWDAAGKGGTIRRLCAALDIRDYRVTPIAAPTEEERAHHYLWRFWQHLPDPGSVAIFDRTWYGRVLVERVEGFAAEHEWRRAYSEIRDFEEQLVEKGIVVCKFWLHISPDEQLRRFKAREQTDYKRYKITDEDYRNREKWPEYEAAIDEMVARTSVKAAPWTLVAANDKRHARVEVIRTYVRALKARLGDSKSKSKRDKKGR